jgi:hypothetical protein
MEFAVPAIFSTRGCWTSAGCTVDTWVSRTAESSGLAAAPRPLFAPVCFATGLVSGLADDFAALVTSAAAAEARAAALVVDFPPAAKALAEAFLASDTLRTVRGETLPATLFALPVPVVFAVAFAPVVFAIAISPRLSAFAPLAKKT